MGLFVHRWVYFVLGGALFTPYALFAMLALPLLSPASFARVDGPVLVAAAVTLVLATIAVTSLLPFVRTLEGAAVTALLGGHATNLVVTPARTPSAKIRNGLWYLAHTVGGAVVSLASVIGVPVALSLLASPWRDGPRLALGLGDLTVARGWGVPLAIALLVGLGVVVVASGEVATWLAPILLGPDPVARLEELERRTSTLTERNRLAQELHDSMGHALTITTLQARAARKVLHSDPAFAERALDAIERTGRLAAADLDDFLGLLRDDSATTAPARTLRDLDALVATHRAAGLPVELAVDGDLATVEGPVSREMYRIVQEGLTNVQRHAGNVATTVRLSICDGRLVALVRNASGPGPVVARSGGRGLAGIRERVDLLGGEVVAGPSGAGPRLDASADAGGWVLDVRVPAVGLR